MKRAALALVGLALALAAAPPAGAQAAAFTPCPGQDGFICATLPVPLDYTSRVAGTIPLHIAVQRKRTPGGKVLVALTGGPGQSGVDAASSFALSLRPALKRYRLAVLDQRGTGRSGVLNCPELQALTSLTTSFPEDMAACARRLGGKRDYFSTTDTVDDLDRLRQALHVDKLALMGISYGTYVATQYARRYPEHTDRLILDSVVAPNGVDQFERDSFQALPRILREQCARGACRGIARDPFADLTTLVGQLRRQPLRDLVHDASGGRHLVRLSQVDMIGVLFAGDLNPFLESRVPGAVASALRGDPQPLLRLRRDAAGAPVALTDLSAGLFAATTCADNRMAFSLQTPLAERQSLLDQALNAVPDQAIAPFDRQAINVASAPEVCLQWPVGNPRPPVTSPLPDVPALIFDGRADLRTPLENGRAVAAQLPHAQVVTIAGTGHDELDSDATGCARRALARFVDGKKVGDPCAGKTNALPLAPIAPTTLAKVPPAGLAGDRGRVLGAALMTIRDVRTSINEALYAGFANLDGGGLRGGRYFVDAASDGGAVIDMKDVAYVPGVRLTGLIHSLAGRLDGVVELTGPHRLRGSLRFSRRRGAVGRIGGARVRLARPTLEQAQVAGPSARPQLLPESLLR